MTTNIAFAGDYNAESIVLIGTAGIKDTTLDISSMIVETGLKLNQTRLMIKLLNYN